MGLSSEGIDNVRAFAIPAGVDASGRSDAATRRVLVCWRAVSSDCLYQVYVNGRLAGVTADTGQRRIVCPVPSSFDSAVRIEVFAVAAEEADLDQGATVDSAKADDGRVRIRLLRRQNLAFEAEISVYGDGGSGVMDYETPLNAEPIVVWPGAADKCGFALSGFGAGGFGYDGSAAIGFGLGSFGRGEFALDADEFEWVSGPLAMGDYRFGVVVRDAAGRVSDASEVGPVFVGPAAKGAETITVSAFDRMSNQLVLSIGG